MILIANEELREKNVKNVLEQALDCFKEFGLEATTIKLVAKRAGVTTRSVSRYFGGKSNLIAEVMRLFSNDFFAKVDEGFRIASKEEKSGFEQVSLYLKLQYAIYKDDYTDFLLVLEMERYLSICQEDNKEAMLVQYFRHMHRYRGILLEILEKGMQDGSIRSSLTAKETCILGSLEYLGFLQRMAMNRRLQVPVDEDIQFRSYVSMVEQYLRL